MIKELFKIARLLLDAKSVAKAKPHKRFVNKWIGKKIVSKLWWR